MHNQEMRLPETGEAHFLLYHIKHNQNEGWSLRKLCAASGCEDIALDGVPHCELHAARAKARLVAKRAKAQTSEQAQFGRRLYRLERWVKESRNFLKANPLCVDCAELGAVEQATDVDHVIPHRGDRGLFFQRSNWQALCHRCHSRKTAREVLHATPPGVGK